MFKHQASFKSISGICTHAHPVGLKWPCSSDLATFNMSSLNS